MNDDIRMGDEFPQLRDAFGDPAFEPAPGVKELTWASIVARMPPDGGPGGTPPPPAPAKAAHLISLGSAGVALIAFVVVAATWGSAAAPAKEASVPHEVHSSPTALPSATSPSAPPSSAIPVVSVDDLPRVVEVARLRAPHSVVAVAPAAPEVPATNESSEGHSRQQKSSLAFEVSAVLEVRAHLRAGAAGAALIRLARLDTEVPAGALTEERAILRVEALAAKGDLVAARAAATEFLAHYPAGPNAERARAISVARR